MHHLPNRCCAVVWLALFLAARTAIYPSNAFQCSRPSLWRGCVSSPPRAHRFLVLRQYTPVDDNNNGNNEEAANNNTHLIELQVFLKITNLVSTGGEAKNLIQGRKVELNGIIETRRSKKLFASDVVRLAGYSSLNVGEEVAALGYVMKVKTKKKNRDRNKA